MNPRYTALPIISLALKILGYLVLIVAVLSAIVYFFNGVPGEHFDLSQYPEQLREFLRHAQPGFIQGHVVPAFSALFNGLIRGVLLIGASELIHVVLDIEDNTRKNADLAAKAPGATVPPPQL